MALGHDQHQVVGAEMHALQALNVQGARHNAQVSLPLQHPATYLPAGHFLELHIHARVGSQKRRQDFR